MTKHTRSEAALEVSEPPPPIVASPPSENGPLLADGVNGRRVVEFRARVRTLIGEHVVPRLEEAESTRRFPREAVADLGRAGLFAERWAARPHGDSGKSVVLAEELGRAGVGGIGVGISLHLEAVTGILLRFGRSSHAREWAQRALNGTAVGCLATSEENVGSNLAGVEATATPDGKRWRIRGRKWFVSPGAAADFAIVLCRRNGSTTGGDGADGGFVPLVLAIVPSTEIGVERRLSTLGMRGLETARLRIDATVEGDAILGGSGIGLAMVTLGLVHERLSIAAQVIGMAELSLALAWARLHRRTQFGRPLYDHQALRLRLADLAAQVHAVKLAIYATAAWSSARSDALREVSGLKVTAARLGERVVSECMHVFGGCGYLEDETPLARLFRDVRVGRIGGGTDEMMWEMVAAGLEPDFEAYERMVGSDTFPPVGA